MGTIITSAVPGSLAFDGAFVQLVPAQPASPTSTNESTLGIVGGATWGKPNTPTPFSNQASGFSAFGNGTTIKNSLIDEALRAMPECTDFLGVRVTDGTDTAAVIDLVDATGFAQDVWTVGGAFAAGVPLSMTITPVSGSPVVVSYTTQTSDANLAGVAASFVAKINASSAVSGPTAFLQQVVASGASFTLVAKVSGASQDAIAIVATGTGVTLTGGANLTGGATPGILAALTGACTGSYANGATARLDLTSGTLAANPIFRLSIFFPGQQTNVFAPIAGSASGGAYAAASFIANLVAAVNGTAPNSVPSPFFVATAGSSTAAPLTATVFTAAGGTDGASGLTTAELLGVQQVSGSTGMYALSGQLNGGTLILAQCDDLAAAQQMIAFAQAQSLFAAIAVGPTGTTTAEGIAAKNAAAASSKYLTTATDWDYVFDSIAGTQRLVSPLGKIAGIIASLPPSVYPGNQPANYTGSGAVGVLATERTAGVPVDPASEGATRQENGILYLTNNTPYGGGVWGLPHGIASDGVTQIGTTRIQNKIALGLLAIGGRFVGSSQTQAPNDQTRTNWQDSIITYLQNLENQKEIADFLVDISGNTPTTISEGYLIAAVTVTSLAGVQFALATLQVGTTVQIAIAA